ncbi:hypothetical protein ACFV1L_28550 [Kitasatospora sp. NPDC059646]|uniref:hypothetical protein n=1 Tax=Kitasatospora sp. NPDC059646 TaxID=3346893 RepID=UPI0036AA88D0
MTGPLRRLAALALAPVTVLFALVLPAGPAAAAAADDPPAAAAIAPVAPSAAYSPSLNKQLAAFNRQLAELPTDRSLADKQAELDRRTTAYNEQSKAVLDALDANDKKIDQHNAEVAQYPNGAPPAVADALNAEAAAINSEQQQLKDRAGKIADEGDAITSEQRDLDRRKSDLGSRRSTLQSTRGQLVTQMAAELLARLAAPAAATGPAIGSDRSRPSGGTPSAGAPRVDGGDRPAGSVRRQPLERYADQHGVRIDGRPVDAVLSPAALGKLSPANAGVLEPTRSYDGLVEQRDGSYRALTLRDPSRPPTAAQRAFDATVNGGGSAVTTVNGRKAVISGVDSVDAPADAPAAPPQRNLALGLGGRVQPFADRNGYEHLMDFDMTQVRRELLGRLNDPNYRIHVSLKDLKDLPNTLARGWAWEHKNARGRIPFENGRLPEWALTWERAPSVTDWEMYLIHTLPGVLERTTFYDENDNVVPDPFLTGNND